MKKIIVASIAFISLGALSWLYGKNPIEESMVTIQAANNKKIHIKKEIAILIPFIKNTLRFNQDDNKPINLSDYSSSTLKLIFSILENINSIGDAKRQDGEYIAQKIQPSIDTALQNKSIQTINTIIAASDFLDLPYIVNGAIRVITQKMRNENPDISVNKIIATIRLLFGARKRSLSITKNLLPLYKKQYYLIKDRETPIPELSIADYIAINGMPKIETFYDEHGNPIHSLSLVQKGLTSLEGILQIDNISSVQKLDLSSNALFSLPPGTFNGLSQLQTLSLYNNQLSSLPPGIFNGLSQLQILSLDKNQLSSLPAGTFNGLSGLQWLHLNKNQLKTLPPGIFNGLSRLQELYLDNNQLSSLPAGIFNELSRLQQLFLYNNQLKTLSPGTFNDLSQLQELYLDNNQLSSLPAGIFNELSRLQQLFLYNNQLKTLSPGTFYDLSQLQSLHLENNQLSSLPAGTFNDLSQLQRLYLKKNQLNMTIEQIKAENPRLPQNVGIYL